MFTFQLDFCLASMIKLNNNKQANKKSDVRMFESSFFSSIVSYVQCLFIYSFSCMCVCMWLKMVSGFFYYFDLKCFMQSEIRRKEKIQFCVRKKQYKYVHHYYCCVKYINNIIQNWLLYSVLIDDDVYNRGSFFAKLILLLLISVSYCQSSLSKKHALVFND